MGNLMRIATKDDRAVYIDNPLPIRKLEPQTNDTETVATVTYTGKSCPSGFWVVIKSDTSDGSTRYASVINNAENTALESYSDVWTNRADLEYGLYDEAF